MRENLKYFEGETYLIKREDMNKSPTTLFFTDVKQM
jgi:hypothetical protein